MDSGERAGNTGTSASAKSARKRNRKSRANREPTATSGTSGSAGSVSPGGSVLGVDGAGLAAGALAELGCVVIDVVCGVNRAKLRVDGLRNGSKTPCIYMDTDAEQLGQDQGQSQGQGEGKDQTRTGELCRVAKVIDPLMNVRYFFKFLTLNVYDNRQSLIHLQW